MDILNISETKKSNLCIGCGLCSVACPESAISMAWQERLVWSPVIDVAACNHCGQCHKVCPHSAQCIVEYATAAQSEGVRFGLAPDAKYFIVYDNDATRRIRSASGGVTGALLEHLITSGSVAGVLGSLPREGKAGEPHFEMRIFRTIKELDQGRSSHYHPLSYDKVLAELKISHGPFVVVGVPCVLRGITRLPSEVQKKIGYKVCLVCSHNVTGAFADCLASKEGVKRDVPYRLNFRDKVGIADANNFNNLFELPDREIRTGRFATAFTDMWRNYFFAQECCLYCADFYGVDADISIKDAWGRLSRDPLGTSLVVVNRPELAEHLTEMKHSDRLYLEECDAEEVFSSQVATPIFKHEKVRDRLVWKKGLKQELDKCYPIFGWRRRWLSRDTHEYWRLWLLMKLSNFFYFRFGKVPVKSLLRVVSPLTWDGGLMRNSCGRLYARMRNLILWPWRAVFYPLFCTGALLTGYRRAKGGNDKTRLRVLIAGGYGYGNVGDEAQLGANLQHWQTAAPGCRLTVLSPDREFTHALHDPIRVELATRTSLFGRGGQQYYGSDKTFKRMYFLVASLCLVNAWLLRAGLPVFGLTAAQARLLDELHDSDVLFLSGGGYLTGMTLTRLWDNMLLIRLAHVLGVPVILSGQTIGVFKDTISRWLARWGLKKAEMIYLRDPVDSARDLADLGLSGDWIKSTFDDALFFQGATSELVAELLEESGIDPQKPYLAVNVHYWGQTPAASRLIMAGVARALDRLQRELELQIVFVPMHSSDETAIEEVWTAMETPGMMPKHGYRPDLTVGLIQNATICITMKHHPIIFAMAAAVPTVSMTFDDYYHHKNYGAMRLFHQEDYLLKSTPKELEEQLCETTKRVFAARQEASQEIARIVEELRPMSGEVIFRFMKFRQHNPFPGC